MPFMVIYRTSDGSSCYEQADAIDEAALLVERLRNKEGLDQIRIYRMEEISFAFRPYYKVELGLTDRHGTHPAAAASSAVVGEGPAAEREASVRADADTFPSRPEVTVDDRPDAASDVAMPTPPPPGAGDETASASGRRSLFGR